MKKNFLFIISCSILIVISPTIVMAGKTLEQTDPVKCLAYYYSCISGKKFRDAYSLRTERANRKTAYEDWYKRVWASNVSLELLENELVEKKDNRAVVQAVIKSVDNFDNKEEEGVYKIKSTLAKSNNLWWIDGFTVEKLENYNPRKLFPAPEKADTPNTGPDTGKNSFLPPGKEKLEKKPETLYEDIPIYPGYKMSPSMVIQDKYEKLPMNFFYSTNTLGNVSLESVIDYYERKMKDQGWYVPGSGAGGEDTLSLYLEKASKKTLIMAEKSQDNRIRLKIFYWKD